MYIVHCKFQMVWSVTRTYLPNEETQLGHDQNQIWSLNDDHWSLIRLERGTGGLAKKEETTIPNLLSVNISQEENMGSLQNHWKEQPDKGIPRREKSQLYPRLSFCETCQGQAGTYKKGKQYFVYICNARKKTFLSDPGVPGVRSMGPVVSN